MTTGASFTAHFTGKQQIVQIIRTEEQIYG
jgi:hypothetical protein